LPVVDGNEYLGLISEDIVYDCNAPEAALQDSGIVYNRPFVYEDRHIYDVMKTVSDRHLSVVPVLDLEDNYLGLTTLPHLMSLITNTASISVPGSVIVLELNDRDYSLGHIAQIIESNDAKILSVYLTSATDSTKIEVTLKINRKEIGGILQTLNRYDYVVQASYSVKKHGDDLTDRYASLMKFLDM